MKKILNPGRERKSVNFIDNITYSRQKDLHDNIIELKMSIMLQNGNSEMKLAAGMDDEEDDSGLKPALLWVPGGGYRGTDKNLMVAEMAYLADEGYVVASIYYRSSAEGHFPDQIIDVKTAVRFLRAHGEEYGIDPERIGIFGRSAGGHLSALAAMNTDEYESGEWAGFSSKVQACCDMFGPVDLVKLMEHDEYMMEHDPDYRWKTVQETHAGALLGGEVSTMKERARVASAKYVISPGMCPIQILHGDADPLVPCEISTEFYECLIRAGLEDQVEYYIIKNGGHGSREFFQTETKKVIQKFFDKYLK